MISTCTANLNLSLSTIGYTEVEHCLIDIDFGDGDDVNSNTLTNCSITGKGKASNGVLFTDDKLPYFTFVSSQILIRNVVSMPSSARIMTSIRCIRN